MEILYNGIHVSYFNNSCGLRPGYLLSPFLFVLVMDVLGRMLEAAAHGSFLSVF